MKKLEIYFPWLDAHAEIKFTFSKEVLPAQNFRLVQSQPSADIAEEKARGNLKRFASGH